MKLDLERLTGKYIKVETEERVYEGEIDPRPELLDSKFITLKLENGYNIGIEKDKIKSVEVIKNNVSENTIDAMKRDENTNYKNNKIKIKQKKDQKLLCWVLEEQFLHLLIIKEGGSVLNLVQKN